MDTQTSSAPTGGDAASSSAAAAEKPWPSERVAWYALFVITLSLLVNFLDRGILALLVPSIQADLELTDTQMGIIMGFAFVMFYAFAGLPIARYADHGNRRGLIALGMALYGGATALCGFAKSFPTLFFARMGVGVGEACSGPASFSLLGDYFPPEKLARPLAIMNYGFIFGNGLALLIGGGVVAYLATITIPVLPVVGQLAPWQVTLILVGIPGLIVSALMMTVPEPERRVKGKPPAISEVIEFLVQNRWVYAPLVIGIALNTINFVGQSSWGPVFFIRTFGWDIGTIALVNGLAMILTMPIGAICGSLLAERWTAKGHADANLRVTIFALALSIPFYFATPLMPTGWLAAGVSAVASFIAAFTFGPQNAAIQVVTPNRMRGQITAVVLFAFNLFGFGLGPTVLGLMTDKVFADPNQIHLAMATMTALLSPLAVFVLWLGMKPYGETVRALNPHMFAPKETAA